MLVSDARKYDRGLSEIPHADLNGLDVADRARYSKVVVSRGLTSHSTLYKSF